MSNGHANCIFAVCCPPYSKDQEIALANEIAAALPWTTAPSGGTSMAGVFAAWVLKNYDLAPPGSLQAFKDEIARLAREGHVKVDPQNEVQG